MSSRQPRYVIYVSPYEWGIVEPIKTVADYMRKRLGDRIGEVSDHHIARIFPIIEEFVQGSKMKVGAMAEILRDLERHFGFSNDEEREEVNIAIARLLDRIEIMKRREPVRVFKLVRNLRTLLIGLVRGRITLPIRPYEKQSEKEAGT